jgi:hypothetical protein
MRLAKGDGLSRLKILRIFGRHRKRRIARVHVPGYAGAPKEC